MNHITLTDNRPVPARYKYPDISLFLESRSWKPSLTPGLPFRCSVYSNKLEGNHSSRRKAFRDQERAAGRLKRKRVAPVHNAPLDLTGEYNRIRDLITKIPEFRGPDVFTYGYKTADDLASEIFLKLFERQFWDKWDPSRASLSTYTYLGVKSLVFNETRASKRLDAYVQKHPQASPKLVRVVKEEGKTIDHNDLDAVSPYAPVDQTALDSVLTQSFQEYLNNLPEKGEFGITYASIFEQLSATSPQETRHAIKESLTKRIPATLPLREVKKIQDSSSQKSKKLVETVQEIFREFIGNVGSQDHPQWAV